MFKFMILNSTNVCLAYFMLPRYDLQLDGILTKHQNLLTFSFVNDYIEKYK